MNILLVAGLLILSQSLHVYSVDDLPVSPTNSEAVLKDLCERFPTLLKSKCKSEQSSVEKDSSSAHLDTLFNTDNDSSHNVPKGACRICLKIIERFEQVIDKSQSPESVQKQFINICGMFNANVKSQCLKFFNGSGLKAIKAILKSENPKKVCQTMNLCLRSESYSQYLEIFDLYFQTQRLDKKSLKSCKICQTVVKVLQRLINPSKTLEDVQKVLFGFCGILKFPGKTFCVYFFSTNGLGVIEGILKKKDPMKICQIMYYCRYRDIELSKNEGTNQIIGNHTICENIKKIFNEITNKPATQRLIKDQLEKVTDEFLRKIDAGGSDLKLWKSIDSCRLCKEVVFIVHRLAMPKKTEESLNEAFNKACVYLPVSNEKRCKEFIKKYRQEIIKMFLNGVYYEDMCKKIQICEEKSTNSIQDLSEKPNSLVDTGEVLKTINSICSVLDSPLKDVCMEIVSHHSLQEVLDKLMKSGHLEELYEVIEDLYKEKNNDSLKTNILPQDNVENPIGCFLCKKVMTKVMKILARDKTKEKIRKALHQVCKYFIGSIREKCKNFVDKYSHKLIKYILKKYTPKMFCKVFSLCSINLANENVNILDILANGGNLFYDSSEKIEINNIKKMEINKDGANAAECVMCKDVMKEIESLIKNKISKEGIEKALKDICHLLPGHLKDQCEDFGQKYRERIVEFFKDDLVTSKICSSLQLCATNDDTSYYLPKTNYL